MGDHLEIWLDATLAGFLAWRELDTTAAAAHWRRAAACLSAEGGPATAFHAVTLNNLAVADTDPVSISGFHDVSAAWNAVLRRVTLEDVPLPARSSVFHLRLASQHAEPFAAFLRRRHLALAGLGLWLSETNARARASALETLPVHLHANDQPLDTLPTFLERAVRMARDQTLDRAAACNLLTAQIEHIHSFRATTGLPVTLSAQLEACLGFCAFAPLADALARPGDRITRET
ncbi:MULTISPECIES: hypothetical protein [Azorhizobium]|uniref:hypothetical protein n=1 Tax=Azorhizobium TaxID=6 RepID=UPI0010D90848|nr:hypothetical protein [Azorhizobium sp. AG788]TDT88467.1 hypothetical protein DFO45_4744 [Azorhizobium sp. AG788]